MTSRDIHLRELQAARLDLDIDDRRHLADCHGEHVQITEADGGGCLVTARDICGVIPLPSGRRLTIEPKIPLSSIWALLALAPEEALLSPPPVAEAPDIAAWLEGLAATFIVQLDQMLARGLSGDFRLSRENLGGVRGRIALQEQLRRQPGMPHRFICDFSEFSADIPRNRYLAAAFDRAALIVGARSYLRGPLERCRATLSAIPRDCMPADGSRSQRAGRQQSIVVALADMLLSDAVVLGGPRRPSTPAVLVEMPRLFERFVCRALAQGLPSVVVRTSGTCVLLDADGRVPLTVDAVLESNGRPLCVVDAKYKHGPQSGRTGGTPTSGDLYQMLAYCLGYGVSDAILVYPHRLEVEPVHICRHGISIRVHSVGIDLSAGAHRFQAGVEGMCGAVARIIGSEGGASADAGSRDGLPEIGLSRHNQPPGGCVDPSRRPSVTVAAERGERGAPP